MTNQQAKYTLTQYTAMAERFNAMSFKEQLEVLINNPDILSLANDYDWWWVEVVDKDIDNDLFILKENQWGWREMQAMAEMLKIKCIGC